MKNNKIYVILLVFLTVVSGVLFGGSSLSEEKHGQKLVSNVMSNNNLTSAVEKLIEEKKITKG